jgi:post-segregation antitoxin (ccd killing protein)
MQKRDNHSRKLLQVSVKADLYERIRAHCDAIDIPMAIWTRELIKRELERNQ